MLAVILQAEEAVSRRSAEVRREVELMTAVTTGRLASSRGASLQVVIAFGAMRMRSSLHFAQYVTARTMVNLAWVPDGLRKPEPWEEVDVLSARRTHARLHQVEVFNVRELGAIQAPCLIEISDLRLDIGDHGSGLTLEPVKIKRGYRLTHSPVSHWVDVTSNDTQSEACCLEDGRAPSHERVCHNSSNVVTAKVVVRQGPLAEFRQ